MLDSRYGANAEYLQRSWCQPGSRQIVITSCCTFSTLEFCSDGRKHLPHTHWHPH